MDILDRLSRKGFRAIVKLSKKSENNGADQLLCEPILRVVCAGSHRLLRTSIKEHGTHMAGRRKNQLDLRGDVVKGKELEGAQPVPKTEALDLTQAREMFTRELRIFSKATHVHHRDCVKALERILGLQGIEIRDVRDLSPACVSIRGA